MECLGRTAGFDVFKQSLNLDCHVCAVVHSPRGLHVDEVGYIDVAELCEIGGPDACAQSGCRFSDRVQGGVECTGACSPLLAQVAQVPLLFQAAQGFVKGQDAASTAAKNNSNWFCQ